MKSLSFDCEASIVEFGANETIGADDLLLLWRLIFSA